MSFKTKLAFVASAAVLVMAGTASAADKIYRLKLAETWPANFPIFGPCSSREP